MESPLFAQSRTTLQRDGQMDGVRDCGTAEWIYLTLLVKKKMSVKDHVRTR